MHDNFETIKLTSTIFIFMFIKRKYLRNLKRTFYFTEKAFFDLRIFQYLSFFPPLYPPCCLLLNI